MEDGVLYISMDQQFPAVEMYFKKNGRLYLIQVSITNSTKYRSNGALAHCLDPLVTVLPHGPQFQ
jgi:hypothetical protein